MFSSSKFFIKLRPNNSKIASFCFFNIITYNDDFSSGINQKYWRTSTNSVNTSRFTMVPTNGVIRMSAAVGAQNAFLGTGLWSALTVYGNFDLSVDFTNANLAWLTGSPGNQAQVNCYFGDFGTTNNFLLVRSDEASFNQNMHVWIHGPADEAPRRHKLE